MPLSGNRLQRGMSCGGQGPPSRML